MGIRHALENEGKAYGSRPNASDGHIILSLTFPIHGETLCQNTHSNLAHGVCCLASEKTRINRRADNNYAGFPLKRLRVSTNGDLNLTYHPQKGTSYEKRPLRN